jgi:hypothetical protein
MSWRDKFKLTGLRRADKTPEAKAVRCLGCQARPLLTYLDPPDNTQAHLTCTNAKCPAPRWTTTRVDGPRTAEQAVYQWNLLNGGGA